MSPARNVPSIVHDLMGRREGKDRKGARGEGGMEGGGRRERGERGGERWRKEGGMEGGGGGREEGSGRRDPEHSRVNVK